MSVHIVYPVTSFPNPDSTAAWQATGTALTSSYSVIGTPSILPIGGATSAFLHIYWTKGNETSIEVQARYSMTNGGTLAIPTVITSGGGTSVIAQVEFSFAGSGNIVVPFGMEGQYVSFFIKATGGTPTGAYGASIFLIRE